MRITRYLALAVVLVVLSGCAQVKYFDIADEYERSLAGEMVVIPSGTFIMGDLSGEGVAAERPVHSVTVPAFKLGKYEVTFAQWDACVADGGCGGYTPDDEGWGRDYRPIISVSWDDIQAFISWLNARTGGDYRLPTEAEWEYAARSGSTTKYHFGNDESRLCHYGNHADICMPLGWHNESCSDGESRSAMVGSYRPNSYGLYDMHGNVMERVEDCWHYNYEGAPSDGGAWISDDCGSHVVRSGSWWNGLAYLHSAARSWSNRSDRDIALGFRLAKDL